MYQHQGTCSSDSQQPGTPARLRKSPRNDIQSGDKDRRERDVREKPRRVVQRALPGSTHEQLRYKGAIPQRSISVEEETDVKQEKTSSTLAVSTPHETLPANDVCGTRAKTRGTCIVSLHQNATESRTSLDGTTTSAETALAALVDMRAHASFLLRTARRANLTDDRYQTEKWLARETPCG